jgi:O-succinylbenzoic acid--CoA ligase
MIQVQDNCFSWEELKSTDETRFEQVEETTRFVLTFCKNWLLGTSSFIFHTSGSTGKPKAIEVSREQMLWSAQNTIDALHLTSTEHILLCINPRMIGGAMMLVRAMMLGCRITVINSSSKILHQLPSDHNYTFASFVPLQLAILMEESTDALLKKLNRFRHILIGGAPLSAALNHILTSCTASVWHTYGMTETISHIALRNVKDTAYQTLPGTRIKLDDRGCLCICNVATQSQWLTTNDMATMIDEEHFTIIGRADEVVNSGGVKFHIRDIEIWLEQLEPQIKFFVTAVHDEKLGDKIVAVFEGKVPNEKILTMWKQAIQKNISAYAVPKAFLVAKAFVKTPGGKINKPQTVLNSLT